jgi:hypothetical protein
MRHQAYMAEFAESINDIFAPLRHILTSGATRFNLCRNARFTEAKSERRDLKNHCGRNYKAQLRASFVRPYQESNSWPSLQSVTCRVAQ